MEQCLQIFLIVEHQNDYPNQQTGKVQGKSLH